jgi:hypothetical protein
MIGMIIDVERYWSGGDYQVDAVWDDELHCTFCGLVLDGVEVGALSNKLEELPEQD